MLRVCSPKKLQPQTKTKPPAVITIPILMLWNVRISWRKKLALIGLFSLTVIVIIFSIVRVAVVTSHKTQADVTWLYMWSNIEMAVCMFPGPVPLLSEHLIWLTKSRTSQRSWLPVSPPSASSSSNRTNHAMKDKVTKKRPHAKVSSLDTSSCSRAEGRPVANGASSLAARPVITRRLLITRRIQQIT